MAKVSKVFPDSDGNVRTIEVLMRRKQKDTYSRPSYQPAPKDLEPLTLPVQRTVIILPVAGGDLML